MDIKTFKLRATVVSAIALATAGMAQAQQTEQTTADAMGGQVVVEQAKPKVSVTIDQPDVNVDQAAPEVTVEQPQPEITVQVPEPDVRVQQQAPIVTVEQAQPVVTVRIPEPIITVRVPRPQVAVDQSNPDVAVQMPEPVVNFIRPEPKIRIEEAEPRIRVEQSEANVNVDANQRAEVAVDQAEPKVNIQQSDDANVSVSQADPKVNVQSAEGAKVDVSQAEAEVNVIDYDADEQGMIADEADRTAYAEGMQAHPLYETRAGDLIGIAVVDVNGENVGEIESVGRRGDTAVLIVAVGGFLGLGEHDVALPVDRVTVREDRILLPDATQEQLENMPEFDEAEVQLADDDVRIRDMFEG